MAEQEHLTERSSGRPEGMITRGTTGINRLRRIDRHVLHDPLIRRALRRTDRPIAVDLGYGDRPYTTVEWARRLRTVRPDIAVVGLEIDPDRVVPDRDGVTFRRGGFELAGRRPTLLRAINVLRQYPEDAVAPAWSRLLSGLQPGGLLIEGTCDELGRHCSWVMLDGDGPVSFTLAWDPASIARPSDLAPRLPKALIHHNVPGEPIHDLLSAADRAWDTAAGHTPFGPRVRWRAALALLRSAGVPVTVPTRRIRDNVLTVPWPVVEPGSGTPPSSGNHL